MAIRRLMAQILGVAAAMTTAACDEVDDVDHREVEGIDDGAGNGDIDARDVEVNGFRLNGFRLNGFRLNGFRLNGQLLTGGEGSGDSIALEQIKVPGAGTIVKSWLAGSNLHVETEGGQVLSGSKLLGADLVFEVTDGDQDSKTRVVKIIGAAPMGPGSDVWLYDFVIEIGGGWQPLCTDNLKIPRKATLLADLWDPETGDRVSPRPTGAVTIACGGAALFKCVDWGYAPWRTVGGTSLAEHHQACTRAVRADYCGDGTPHTVDGIAIHLKDSLGIEVLDLLTPHVVEAEWSASGALCLNPDNTRVENVSLACQLPTCNEWYAKQSLLQTGTLL